MSSNNVVGDLWIGGPMRRGPMRWGTNEMGDQWVGGTNEMGDQWNEWCMGANWGIYEIGDQWDGGPMRWGTNEMGDQWDGGPMMCTRKINRSSDRFIGTPGMAIPMFKIRRPKDRLTFNMEITLPRDKKRGPGRIPSWDRVSLVNQFTWAWHY